VASRCAPCLVEWEAIDDVEERKKTANQPRWAITTVGGVPVCSEHVDDELAKVRERRVEAN
jgi:hypothetical protein